MALTDNQRHMIREISSAAAYLRQHSNGKPATLQSLIERAGINHLGSFYAMVDNVKRKKEPVGLELLKDLKRAMKEIRIEPSCLEKIPSVDPEKVPPMPKTEMVGSMVAQMSPMEGDLFSNAWLTCRNAMIPLTQPMRENLIQSLSSSFGLGA